MSRGDEHLALRGLINALKQGSDADVQAASARLTGLLSDPLFFLEFSYCILRLTKNAGMKPEEVLGSDLSHVLKICDDAVLQDWCRSCCLRLCRHLRCRKDPTGHVMEKAKAFIAEHFRDSDLSVKTLCRHLHLSQTYFSTLFKRQTGMSFTAYVTQLRMAAAAEAMRHTRQKTYLIAHACGYDDPNYFSSVFKRHFGVTPTQYRSQ